MALEQVMGQGAVEAAEQIARGEDMHALVRRLIGKRLRGDGLLKTAHSLIVHDVLDLRVMRC